jgi:hypothetical protein
MTPIVRALLAFAAGLVRSRVSLQLEILALRHQLGLYQRSSQRPQVHPSDRILWSWLARHWSRWREVLVFVQPATVLAWQRTRFREHWARLSRREPGRPAIPNKPGRGILRLLEIVEEPAPPGRFLDRRRLDAEMRCQGATGAAEDRQPEGGDTGPRAHSGT